MAKTEKLMDLETSYGLISLSKKPRATALIRTKTPEAMAYGLGWLHGTQRPRQLLLSRALVRGRLTDFLKSSPVLLDTDRFIRTLDLLPNSETETATLEGANRIALQAYCYGVNAALAQSRWKNHPKWTMEDSLLLARTLNVFSWLETRYEVHRYLQKMVKDGLTVPKIKELFPESSQSIDLETWCASAPLPELPPESANWLAMAPRWRGFSALLLGKDLTTTGGPLLGFSWTMDCSRPGSPFFHITWHSPEGKTGGWGIPGIPAILAGYNPHMSWAGAPSADDNWLLVLEHVKKGLIQNPEGSAPVNTQQETYNLDAKHKSVETRGMSSRGVLPSYPPRDGVAPALAWAGRQANGTLNMLMNIMTANGATQAANLCRGQGSPLLDWAFADRTGEIARTQSGALWDLPAGYSSWIPFSENTPLVLKTPQASPFDSAGPSGKLFLPWAGRSSTHYIAERLKQLITPATRFSPTDVEKILADEFSIQGQKVLAELRFTLPDDALGKALRAWDWTCRGQRESLLFEELHLDVLQTLFGKVFSSLDIWKEFHHHSPIFHELLPRYDGCLFNPVSPWTGELSKEKALSMAVRETAAKAERDTAPLTLLLYPPVWKEKNHTKAKDSGLKLTGGRFSIQSAHLENLGGRLSAFFPRIKAIFDPAGNQAWIDELDLGDESASCSRRIKGLRKLRDEAFRHEYI